MIGGGLAPASAPTIHEPMITNRVAHSGALSEQIASTELFRLGYRVLKPTDPCSPYDLVIDSGSRFIRVQVKTAAFQTEHTCGFRTHARSGSYEGLADVFVVYYPTKDELFLVPVSSCPVGRATITHGSAPWGYAYHKTLRHSECLLKDNHARLLGPAAAG